MLFHCLSTSLIYQGNGSTDCEPHAWIYIRLFFQSVTEVDGGLGLV